MKNLLLLVFTLSYTQLVICTKSHGRFTFKGDLEIENSTLLKSRVDISKYLLKVSKPAVSLSKGMKTHIAQGLAMTSANATRAAIDLDGVDDFLQIPASVGNFNYNKDFTLSLWVKIPSAIKYK
ncbi:hypothetical protein SAMN06298216_4266 [Spirosomataceae bacterium TFI 002]|nr:hypothetical protein SAMN06298216_4266 [Spirosomataceae bacterium TFI 002]